MLCQLRSRMLLEFGAHGHVRQQCRGMHLKLKTLGPLYTIECKDGRYSLSRGRTCSNQLIKDVLLAQATPLGSYWQQPMVSYYQC